MTHRALSSRIQEYSAFLPPVNAESSTASGGKRPGSGNGANAPRASRANLTLFLRFHGAPMIGPNPGPPLFNHPNAPSHPSSPQQLGPRPKLQELAVSGRKWCGRLRLGKGAKPAVRRRFFSQTQNQGQARWRAASKWNSVRGPGGWSSASVIVGRRAPPNSWAHGVPPVPYPHPNVRDLAMRVPS